MMGQSGVASACRQGQQIFCLDRIRQLTCKSLNAKSVCSKSIYQKAKSFVTSVGQPWLPFDFYRRRLFQLKRANAYDWLSCDLSA